MKVRTGHIARYLRRARTRRGLSQWDVGKFLGHSSSQFVSNWERGLSRVPLKSLRALVRLYQIDSAELAEVVLRDQRDDLIKAFNSISK